MSISNTDITVIIADGRFPTNEVPLAYLQKAKRIICCDGAIDYIDKISVKPDVIIGDMDSASQKNLEKYKDIIIRNSDQNTNDLTKAVNYCVSKGYANIVLLGATGYREDHALGNISLLADYSEIADVKMITNFGTFTCFRKTQSFPSFIQQQVSIFCLDPTTKMSSIGLEYPLNNVDFNAWWKGTLNSSLGESFRLESNNDTPIIVFQTHQGKSKK